MNTIFFQKAADKSANLSWKDIFSDVLKPHTEEQRERQLVKGIGSHVPEATRMLEEWQKPWLFLRFGVIGMLLSVLALGIWNTFSLAGLDFAVYLIMAFFPPLTVLLFFWEMNIPGTVSVFKVLFFMLLGGLLSLLVTGLVWVFLPNVPEALGGPLPEEIAKFAIVYFILRNGKYKYGLEGILLGGAVGAGFAAIETAGYGLTYYNQCHSQRMIEELVQIILANVQVSQEELINYVNENMSLYALEAQKISTNILIMRGCLAFGGHVLWAAMYGGALGLTKKGGKKLETKSLGDPLVLITWAAAFILHTMWNLDYQQLAGVLPETMINTILKMQIMHIWHIILIVAGWSILLVVMRKCIRQIVAANQRALAMSQPIPQPVQPSMPQHIPAGAIPQAAQASAQTAGRVILAVTASGELNPGKVYELKEGTSLVFGRDKTRANVVFPSDTKGVSSLHCEIKVKQGYPVLIDRNSSYGTFFSNGQKLEPNVPYKLKSGVKFYLAAEKNKFEVNM